MKYIAVVLSLTFSFNSWAVFQKIWQGYQVSAFNKSQHLDMKINEANYSFELNKYDWQLQITPQYENTFRDALFDFQSQNTTTNSLSYGLVKPTYKWGTFSITQTQIQYDLSQWSRDIDSDKKYEVQNNISYTYDFFDKSSDKDFEITELNNEKGKAQAKLNIEKGYFDFFTVYLQAKLQVFTVELSKEFVSRAQKRVNQVSKRVKDGLSRRVELDQARSSLLNQKEALESSRSALKQNLAILENIIGRKIEDTHFAKISWERKEFSQWKTHIKESKHYSLEVLEESLKVSEKALEKIANETGYKLLLSANYSTNDIDNEASESMNNSLNGEHYSRSLSLNFVIPLGGDKRSGLRKKYAFQKKKNEFDIITKKDELKATKEALLEQISFLEKATSYSIEKVKLAKKILNEQNRLYLRGQASFNDVITAEESYINAQLTEKKLLAQYETLIGNFAFFNNSIKPILDIYQD